MFLAIGESDFMVTTPDNYYWSTKGGLRGVAFRVGAEVYPFEQFDQAQPARHSRSNDWVAQRQSCSRRTRRRTNGA